MSDPLIKPGETEEVEAPDPENPDGEREQEMVIVADEGGNEYLLPEEDTAPVTQESDR